MSAPESTRQNLIPAMLLLYTLVGPLLGGGLFAAFVINYSETLLNGGYGAGFVVGIIGALLVAAALVPSILLAAILGYLGGANWWGLFTAILAIGAGTFLGIALGRLLTAHHVQNILARKPAWQAWFDRIHGQPWPALVTAVFLARLSPHMPFAATNLLLSQLPYSVAKLSVVSVLGLIPRTAIAVAAGSGLASFEQWRELHPELPFGHLATVAFLALFFYLSWRAWRRRSMAISARDNVHRGIACELKDSR